VVKPPKLNKFSTAPNDPLAEEHVAVKAWVEAALGTLSKHEYYRDVDLKTLPTGQALLDSRPEQSLRYLLAAMAQVQHWDQEAEQIRSQGTTELERKYAHHLPGWGLVWGHRSQAAAVINALMRRALPFQKQDLIAVLNWCNKGPQSTVNFCPSGSLTRALERYAAKTPVDTELREAMKQFAARLRGSTDKDSKRLGTAVEQLCAADGTEPAVETAPVAERQPVPTPSPAGSAFVLQSLKRLLGLGSNAEEPQVTSFGPDRFPLSTHSPLRVEHEWLSTFFEEVIGTPHYYSPTLSEFPTGRALLDKDPTATGKVILAAAERHVNSLSGSAGDYTDTRSWQSRYAAAAPVSTLLNAGFELDRDGLFDVLLYLSVLPSSTLERTKDTTSNLIARVETEVERSPLTAGERYVLWLFRASRLIGPALGVPSPEVMRLSLLINDGVNFYLTPGEVWSDAVNTDLTQMAPAKALAWVALFKHTLSATSSRPSARWLANGGKLLHGIGDDDVRDALQRWLPLVTQGQSIRKLGQYSGDTRGAGDVMNEENANALRGLLWLIQTMPRQDRLARSITSVALSAYKKVPGIGPRAVKVGNAAVYALSELRSPDAVGQLAMLKVRIKFGTAQKEIEKAFNTAAEALGLPRDQIEEMGVPSYGMEEVGRRVESFGDYQAELIVTGSDAELKWSDTKGKLLKSVPAKVKSDNKDDLKELQQSLKDIQSMLPAQRDRLDSMYLLQKTWSWDDWRERYLNHPLIGTIARRLIWRLDGTPVLFHDGAPTDVQGSAIVPGTSAKITLWHPVECDIEEITAWRRRLEELEVTQPFKQAHREIYLLTDAERNTRTYSNRFAAHILRQHQFNALCGARGWKNKLRLMVDDSYPPATKELPQWGLRAEFWIEGIGQNYGDDTNDSGVYLRLSTDQVRFYRTAAAAHWAHAGGGGYETAARGPGQDNINEPMLLEQIPPLVFSEIMRDVDLFVGVSSVGNDPTWQDGGPDGRYREYWQSYSFGELSGTATTRKQVLERLVPRLKIADRCSFADRFLVVRGQKRTYKIHLGSGNILMEPNDEYLCIVPDSRSRARQDDLFLPFEGDNTLSIIISKAFLLAEDSKIIDPTITRQINRR
jgi:Domain of unknown function (DUF4132)